VISRSVDRRNEGLSGKDAAQSIEGIESWAAALCSSPPAPCSPARLPSRTLPGNGRFRPRRHSQLPAKPPEPAVPSHSQALPPPSPTLTRPWGAKISQHVVLDRRTVTGAALQDKGVSLVGQRAGIMQGRRRTSIPSTHDGSAHLRNDGSPPTRGASPSDETEGRAGMRRRGSVKEGGMNHTRGTER